MNLKTSYHEKCTICIKLNAFDLHTADTFYGTWISVKPDWNHGSVSSINVSGGVLHVK